MSGVAIAVGMFDGLHLGHRSIIERALRRADGGRCLVVTFDPHPDVVLAKGPFKIAAPLTPILEKRARLTAMGVDELVILPFTRELASLEPEAFVADHLVKPFGMTVLVVGNGFALGRGRSGNVPRLRTIGEAMGFAVEEVPLLELAGESVSSTRIRAALAEGRVADAVRLLGRRYSLAGAVVTGDGIGRTLGFPTANLRLAEEKLLPRDGVYAARARVGDESEWRPAAMSVGMRPTFDGQTRTIEAFLLDWSGELPGRSMELEFVEWLRSEEKFGSTADLVKAMERDVAETRRVLATH